VFNADHTVLGENITETLKVIPRRWKAILNIVGRKLKGASEEVCDLLPIVFATCLG
jgi:hypothetical protein